MCMHEFQLHRMLCKWQIRAEQNIFTSMAFHICSLTWIFALSTSNFECTVSNTGKPGLKFCRNETRKINGSNQLLSFGGSDVMFGGGSCYVSHEKVSDVCRDKWTSFDSRLFWIVDVVLLFSNLFQYTGYP